MLNPDRRTIDREGEQGRELDEVTSTTARAAWLEIIKPGMLAQIQDRGRIGFLRYGVSHAGVMDAYAAAWANRLVGNEAHAAVIEVTLGGLQFRPGIGTWIAVTGATLDVHVDGNRQAVWSRFWVAAGQTVSLGFASSGQRAYVAVPGGDAGGIQVPWVLESSSTHQRNQLGGLKGDGRSLQQGDFIPLSFNHGISNSTTTSTDKTSRNREPYSNSARAHWEYIPDYSQQAFIRFQAGVDWRRLTGEQQNQFLNQTWKVSSQSDRMGVRLTHEHPIDQPPKRQLSLGITPGAIQLPPAGEPIVLAADCQTMGGYPVLGWVHPLDMGVLAQTAPHGEIRFVQTEIDTIQSDMARFDDFFAVIP